MTVCVKHKDYEGKYAPRVPCSMCWLVFNEGGKKSTKKLSKAEKRKEKAKGKGK